jgi:outer membrane protein assembly factor BamD
MISASSSRRWYPLALAGLAVGLAGCGGSTPPPKATPTPVSDVAESASAEEIDQLWRKAETGVRHGKWGDVVKDLDRLLLEFQPGDRRIPQAHLWEGEAQLALGSNLQAAREFRKTSDDSPNDPLAPEALLRVGDAYADLWRRPELDPSYGQTALATYQELLNRYPNTSAAKRAQQRIDDLQERFAYKEYKAALYYIRLKAYDSAILYLKDVVATYPRATVAPDALLRLVQAYRTLGYKEDVQETCGYIRRFHPKAPGAGKACPEGPEPS